MFKERVNDSKSLPYRLKPTNLIDTIVNERLQNYLLEERPQAHAWLASLQVRFWCTTNAIVLVINFWDKIKLRRNKRDFVVVTKIKRKIIK